MASFVIRNYVPLNLKLVLYPALGHDLLRSARAVYFLFQAFVYKIIFHDLWISKLSVFSGPSCT